jgi:hypothetical protein
VSLTDRVPRSDIPRTLLYHRCQEEHDPSGAETCRNKICAKPFFVPTVSKQFWFEAAGVFLETTTFDFNSQAAFHTLATSGQAYVPRILSICLRDTYGALSTFGRIWDSALNSATVGLLEGLRGVRLQLIVDGYEYAEVRKGNIMGSSNSQLNPFRKVLRSLKQHRLEEKSTTVSVALYNFSGVFGQPATIVEDLRISEIIKKELLEHDPPRRSTRRSSGA